MSDKIWSALHLRSSRIVWLQLPALVLLALSCTTERVGKRCYNSDDCFANERCVDSVCVETEAPADTRDTVDSQGEAEIPETAEDTTETEEPADTETNLDTTEPDAPPEDTFEEEPDVPDVSEQEEVGETEILDGEEEVHDVEETADDTAAEVGDTGEDDAADTADDETDVIEEAVVLDVQEVGDQLDDMEVSDLLPEDLLELEVVEICTPENAATFCPREDEATCGRTGFCTAEGGCELYGPATLCDDGLFCTAIDTCDGAGSCQGGDDPCIAANDVCWEDGDECCTPEATVECDGDTVVSVDSCDRVDETSVDVCEDCEHCIEDGDTAACEARDPEEYRHCDGGDVYFYDSCGERAALDKLCGATDECRELDSNDAECCDQSDPSLGCSDSDDDVHFIDACGVIIGLAAQCDGGKTCVGDTCSCEPGFAGTNCSVAVRFVSKDGDNTNGLTWATAFTSVQPAIDDATIDASASSRVEVWVAGGTYESSASVVLAASVDLLGGFSGSEVEREQRNWLENETILDGDDSAEHVVLGNDDTLIDGFTITGGDAVGGTVSWGAGMMIAGGNDLTISNCWFHDNAAEDGGAIGTLFVDEILIANCVFENNSAENGGGALVFQDGDSTITIVNSLFFNNQADNKGSALWNWGENNTIDIINSTITKNDVLSDSGNSGGALYVQSDGTVVTILNSIVWGNTYDSSAGPDIAEGAASHTTAYCSAIREAKLNGVAHDICGDASCIDTAPSFADEQDNDFHVTAGSPVIDKCSDGGAVPDRDLRFHPRTDIANVGNSGGNIVDAGVYEYGEICDTGADDDDDGDVNCADSDCDDDLECQ